MDLDFPELLKSKLSPTQLHLVRAVADEAALHGLALYAVGGLPRDLVLGVEHSDLDLVVEGEAIALARALATKYGGEVVAHAKFGTARWTLRGTRFEGPSAAIGSLPPVHTGHFLDLISARSETYDRPAALPKVSLARIEDDLARRDFTINTLALRLDGVGFGELRDTFGAVEDLRRGIVRVLHARSFTDDPTRIYRAVRYEQRFGFRIAADTLALIPAARSLVGELSSQRIRHELDLILTEEHAELMLGRLAKLKLLRPIHADLPRDKVAASRIRAARQAPTFSVAGWTGVNAAWVLWLMTLSQRQIASVHRRLHFTQALAQTIASASSLRGRLPALRRWKPSRCVKYLDSLPPLAVYAVLRGTPAQASRSILEKYLVDWRLVRPLTTGKDLKLEALAPGPAYKIILRALRAAWLDGLVTNADEERRQLRLMLRKHSKSRAAPQRATSAVGHTT